MLLSYFVDNSSRTTHQPPPAYSLQTSPPPYPNGGYSTGQDYTRPPPNKNSPPPGYPANSNTAPGYPPNGPSAYPPNGAPTNNITGKSGNNCSTMR